MSGVSRRYRPDRPIVPELASGAVIVHRPSGDVYLLHYRAEDRWGLPKGHVDPGESLAAAAVREVMEETGFHDVDLGPEIAEVSYRFYDAGRDVNVHKSSVYFLASTTERTAEPEDTFDTAAWVPLADALGRVRYESDKQVLLRAQSHLAEAPGARIEKREGKG